MIAATLAPGQARPFNPFEEELPCALAVFGTGARGRACRARLERLGIAVPCFLDNNPARQGTVVDGLPVLPPGEFLERLAGTPILIASFAHEEIFGQLRSMGVIEVYRDGLTASPPLRLLRERSGELAAVRDLLSDDLSRRTFEDVLRLRFYATPLPGLSPYPIYAHPLALARPGDVIIDGGAACGDTAGLFLEQSGGSASVHCFEPSAEAFGELAGKRWAGDVRPVRAALWSETGRACFFEAYAMPHGNRLVGHGGTQVQTVTLDEYVESNGLGRVDLVKLDLEGAEAAALRGAARTIRRFRPRLHVCLYHEHDDLWELPLLIRDIVPDYAFHLGHHSPTHLDTVLYCVTE